MARGLDFEHVWSCYGVLRVRAASCALTLDNWAVIAAGVHLFPFRTEKLSPLAPMVLGAQAPGRVGRRPFLRRPPKGGLRRSRRRAAGRPRSGRALANVRSARPTGDACRT